MTIQVLVFGSNSASLPGGVELEQPDDVRDVAWHRYSLRDHAVRACVGRIGRGDRERRAARGLAVVMDHDVGALSREGVGDATPEIACAPGDDRDLVCQLFRHGYSR